MGFMDFVKKFKESMAKNAKVTKRYNDMGFLGNIDRGLKNGDFGIGVYLNMENNVGIIYGANIDDYTFSAEDIVDFEVKKDYAAQIAKGGNNYPAKRCIITFKDGKKAQADILSDKFDKFKKAFHLTEGE